MIIRLDDTQEAPPNYDLCLVGSGPAGMTVANELKDAGLRICVLESGERKRTRRGDRLREVRSEGIHIKDYSRERVLGGASSTWSGLSSPLDEADMHARPFLRDAAWPFTRAELLPFYDEAAERYRFPPLAFFGAEGFGALRGEGTIEPEWSRLDEKVFLAASDPQHFGREHRAAFDVEGVDLILDATVVRLELEEGTSRVALAVVRTSSGREVRVRARAFVVGTGGIENARLLLNSGLGNEHDQVGRYLMNHPKNYHGILHLERPVEELPYYFGCLYHGYAGYAGLRLNEAELDERGLLNSYVRFEPLFPWSDNQGIEALVLLVKRSRFFMTRWKKGREDEVIELRDYSETGDDSDFQNERKSALEWLGLVLKIVINSPRVAQYLFFRLSRAKPKIRRVRLRNFMEMEPDPENRVVLSDERDEYGQPVPLVRHRCTELDKRSLVVLHEVLVEEFERAGLGRLETDLDADGPWPIDQDASHHMGTTRMGRDPRTSVVDPDCRVHGVENLYIAGSSVFPRSGCANPTFTLVALAIRLARHLRAELAA
ncbi:MAG: GMC family oxidoreductase [Planctomycetota bacterium]|nr:GMC family oxidoreductase [Planctomycetota bacterium]